MSCKLINIDSQAQEWSVTKHTLSKIIQNIHIKAIITKWGKHKHGNDVIKQVPQFSHASSKRLWSYWKIIIWALTQVEIICQKIENKRFFRATDKPVYKTSSIRKNEVILRLQRKMMCLNF